MTPLLETAGLVLIGLAAGLVLIFREWRLAVAGLALQYLGVFIWLAGTVGLEAGAVKIISGWMAAAILGATWRAGYEASDIEDAGRLFKFFIFVVLLLVAWSVGPAVINWVPESPESFGFGGVMLIAAGLLRLGFHRSALQVVLCLLFLFSGFELWLIFIDGELFTVVVLGILNLALALVGAYLHTPGAALPGGSTPE